MATTTAVATNPTPKTPAATLARSATASAVDVPTGARASTGCTLYTWRAANAAATTLMTTHAATPTGIAYAGQDVLDSRLVSLQQRRGQQRDRLPADQHTERRSQNATDQPHQSGLHQQIPDHLPALGADRTKHRDLPGAAA